MNGCCGMVTFAFVHVFMYSYTVRAYISGYRINSFPKWLYNASEAPSQSHRNLSSSIRRYYIQSPEHLWVHQKLLHEAAVWALDEYYIDTHNDRHSYSSSSLTFHNLVVAWTTPTTTEKQKRKFMLSGNRQRYAIDARSRLIRMSSRIEHDIHNFHACSPTSLSTTRSFHLLMFGLIGHWKYEGATTNHCSITKITVKIRERRRPKKQQQQKTPNACQSIHHEPF